MDIHNENALLYLRDKQIAFLGDSITFGVGLDDRSLRYSSVLCTELGAVEINLGVTRTLIANAGLCRYERNSFTDRVSGIDGCDIAVIFGGTNDYFWSDRPIFPSKSRVHSNEFFSIALRSLFDSCLRSHDASDILAVTPYPHCGIGNFLGGSGPEASNTHETNSINFNGQILSDYVRVIREEAACLGIPVLDLHDNFDFDWKKHTVDGCHPNAEGHRRIAEAIKNKLILMYSR